MVGVQATGARLSEESIRTGHDRSFTQWQGRKPESIAADASYGNGQFLQWLTDREIKPYMPTRDAVEQRRSLLYGPESFTYLPESNSYICPAGQQLNYGGRNEGNRTFGYIGTRKKCGPCEQRSQCTTGPFRYLAIHMNEAARQRARDLRTTPEFGQAQRQRKKVEALFAELKSHSHIGLHRLRLRRLKFITARAVLPGGHCPEHQAASPVPQLCVNDVTGFPLLHRARAIPTNSTTKKRSPRLPERGDFFNTHRASHSLTFRRVRRPLTCKSPPTT